MKKKVGALIASLIASTMLVTACGSDEDSDSAIQESTVTVDESSNTEESTPVAEQTTTIVLGDSIKIDGGGAEASSAGIRITESGTYTISGALENGMIEVDAAGEAVELVLNGVAISNVDGPAILFTGTSSAIVTLAEGTMNRLSDGGDGEYDGALYSTGTLTVQGSGRLDVEGNAEEGIASEMHLNIDGGTIHITSKDDGLNANNDYVSIITINDGYLYIEAGGDGIDSNGALTINGGTVIALSSLTDANGGLDADGEVLINGGTVIATGERLSVPETSTEQKTIIVDFRSPKQANSLVSIMCEGNELLTFAPALTYRSLLFSSAELADDRTYDIYNGGSALGNQTDGVYEIGTYTAGMLTDSVTTQSINSYSKSNRMPPR